MMVKAKEFVLDKLDKNTLEHLFAEHRERLLTFVRRRLDPALSRKVDPDEIVADAFIRAASRLEDLRQWGIDNSYRWIEWIVGDCIKDTHDYYSTKGRDIHIEQRLPQQSASRLEDLVSPATTPTDAIARREREEWLMATFEQLKPDDQAILRLVTLEGQSFRDAAKVLGIEVGTARVRHFRAVLRFSRLWKEGYGKEGSNE